MSGRQVGTAGFGLKLCLNIDALLKENALEERVLVSEHQAFFGGGAVRRLKVVQVGLMDANGLLELLDIFGASFAKGGLGLSVALFALLRGCIDRLAATLSLGLLAVLRDIDDVAAAAGRHGRSLLPLRGGTGRVVALVAVVRVRPRVLGRRLVVDGHDVGHALGDGAGAR